VDDVATVLVSVDVKEVSSLTIPLDNVDASGSAEIGTLVRYWPEPEKVVALTVPTTSSLDDGLDVPMPTNPSFVNRAVSTLVCELLMAIKLVESVPVV